MRTWPLGSQIFVIGNVNNHNYVVGRAYIVAEIDDDGTLRARDPETGVVGNWLRWQDVDSVAPVGWQWARTVLPPEVVLFLEAFEGIEQITLRESMKARLMARLPSLFEAILDEAQKMRAEETPAPTATIDKTQGDAALRRFFSATDKDNDDDLAS
jgi:hypothetical protein